MLDKILTIGFDNAFANTASIKNLIEIYQPNLGGRFFHVRCTCHVLNLCVQDGLNELQCYIDPIKKTLNCIWSHSNVRREWVKFYKENVLNQLNFHVMFQLVGIQLISFNSIFYLQRFIM